MIKWVISFICLFVFCHLQAQETDLNVMSFNIRYANPEDGENYWPNRRIQLASMIQFYEADIIGIQEALRVQLDDLMRLLPEYKWIGVCRTDGTTQPDPDNEFSAILYKEDVFEVIQESTFWLSDKPDVVGSVGWDAALPRIATWAEFKHQDSGKSFFFFNTHFDHRGEQARVESARLIIDRTKQIAGKAPIILTGDFNALPSSDPYQTLTQKSNPLAFRDAIDTSREPHFGPLSTFNGFKFPEKKGVRIDYIFIKNAVKVLKHAILAATWNGKWPSDHLPVLAKIQL